MMNASYVQRQTCRLCDSQRLELVVPIAPTPIGDAYVPAGRLQEGQPVYPTDLYLCCECGHVQLLDVVNPELLYGEYTYETLISLGLPEHFQRSADEVLERLPHSAGALSIDLGSNDGTLLRCFQRRGLRVLGIDPARAVAQKATASGIETLPEFFTHELGRRLRQERGPALLVTANNMMANIDLLSDFIQGVRELLGPDGLFIFETGYLLDLVEKDLLDNIYHEHLGYFSVQPLERFFRRHHMELIDVERVPTKGGSLRGVVQMAGGPRDASPSVKQFIDLEQQAGVSRPEALQTFAHRMEQVKQELHRRLGELKAQGKTIAGYGASVGVTTLLYQFDLGSLVEYLVDDNPIKHGLFSPGLHLPVRTSESLYDCKPDVLLILAWRYAEPILRKHVEFLERGGQVLIPLPSVTVRSLEGAPAS